MIDEVAVHVGAFVHYEAVQNGVVAVHVCLRLPLVAQRGGVISPTLLGNTLHTLRFGAEVTPVGVGTGALVGEQVLGDRLLSRHAAKPSSVPPK